MRGMFLSTSRQRRLCFCAQCAQTFRPPLCSRKSAAEFDGDQRPPLTNRSPEKLMFASFPFPAQPPIKRQHHGVPLRRFEVCSVFAGLTLPSPSSQQAAKEARPKVAALPLQTERQDVAQFPSRKRYLPGAVCEQILSEEEIHAQTNPFALHAAAGLRNL